MATLFLEHLHHDSTMTEPSASLPELGQHTRPQQFEDKAGSHLQACRVLHNLSVNRGGPSDRGCKHKGVVELHIVLSKSSTRKRAAVKLKIANNNNNNKDNNNHNNHNNNLQLDAVRAGSARGGQLPHWHSQ